MDNPKPRYRSCIYCSNRKGNSENPLTANYGLNEFLNCIQIKLCSAIFC